MTPYLSPLKTVRESFPSHSSSPLIFPLLQMFTLSPAEGGIEGLAPQYLGFLHPDALNRDQRKQRGKAGYMLYIYMSKNENYFRLFISFMSFSLPLALLFFIKSS